MSLKKIQVSRVLTLSWRRLDCNRDDLARVDDDCTSLESRATEDFLSVQDEAKARGESASVIGSYIAVVSKGVLRHQIFQSCTYRTGRVHSYHPLGTWPSTRS